MVTARLKALALSAGLLAAARGAFANEESLIPIRTHSLYMPYVDHDMQNRWFDYGGDAIINTNKGIRLTPDRQSQSGWVWSKLPVTAANWEVEFEFRVGSEGNQYPGDGFAFWATEERGSPGPVFGNKDFFKGLGIFFDTYPNSGHTYTFPYVMAMVGDGKTAYDLANDGEKNKIGGCSADFRNSPVTAKARIKYYKGRFLEVSLAYEDWDKWQTCFVVDDVKLPVTPYLGFTALTGEVHDAQDLISVTTSSIVLGDSVPSHSSYATNAQTAGVSSSGWGFFGWLLVLTILGGVGFVLFRMYQQKDAKRF